MRIKIFVSLLSATSAREVIFWESLTVASIEQAEAHCLQVQEANDNVHIALFTIDANECSEG